MSPHLTHTTPGAGITPSATSKPANLPCSHCQGHLVADLYFDTVDAGGHVWIRALRCVKCGNIEEAGRAGLASHLHAGKSLRKRDVREQNGFDDERIVLGI